MNIANLFEIYQSILPYSIPISMLLGAFDGMHIYALKNRHENNTLSATIYIIGGSIWGGLSGYFYPLWIPYSLYKYLSDKNNVNRY